jgi:pSer/pThr/pTyr-binding forkhead associated (FHA) protein
MSLSEILPSWHLKSNSYHPYVIKIYKKDDLLDTISLNDCQYLLFGRKPTSDPSINSDSHDGQCLNCVLDHQSISRKHAVLFFGENNLTYLMDLKSSHGTRVNDQLIPSNEPFLISENSLIQFGQSTRRYSYCRNDHRPAVPIFQNPTPRVPTTSSLSSASTSSTVPTSPSISPSLSVSVSTLTVSSSQSQTSDKIPPLTKEEERKLRQKEIASYALEMSSTVPIFTTTKKTLSKAELLAAAQVSLLPLPSLSLSLVSLRLDPPEQS